MAAKQAKCNRGTILKAKGVLTSTFSCDT